LFLLCLTPTPHVDFDLPGWQFFFVRTCSYKEKPLVSEDSIQIRVPVVENEGKERRREFACCANSQAPSNPISRPHEHPDTEMNLFPRDFFRSTHLGQKNKASASLVDEIAM
jgi:hypothetical protein